MSYSSNNLKPVQTEPQERSDHSLPRLLYIGDVPVTSTIGGAVLLYRLLQNYPAERLRVIQGNLWSQLREWGNGDFTKRLPQVNYDTLDVGSHRFLTSRISSHYAAFLQLTASIRAKKVRRHVDEFRPDAIITAVHGFSWVTAAKVAAAYELPLHLIIHDEWVHGNHLPGGLQKWAERQFSGIYRQARSRFCASQYMAEDYERRYGESGTVLYPLRGPIGSVFGSVSEKPSDRFPAFAYAGSINSGGYAKCISDLAHVLERFSGCIRLFTPHSKQDLARYGLLKSNIISNPLIPERELTTRLREEADVLFAPMTFEEGLRKKMEVGFPSKITDYTATGRPILIWGPSYCSAVRWALDNPGVAEIVEEPSLTALAASVERLISDSNYRHDLGASALSKGQEYFSHAATVGKFYRSIIQTCS